MELELRGGERKRLGEEERREGKSRDNICAHLKGVICRGCRASGGVGKAPVK